MMLCPKLTLLWARHQDEILKLMREDATPEQWSDWLRPPLEHAAARGNGRLVTSLLKMGANGSTEGPKGCGGRTLLDAAVEGGNADVVNTLLRAGSRPDVNVDAAKRSPLHTSICGGHLATAKALVAAGADVNHFDRHDLCSPLHAAISRGYEDLVTHLLIGGADPNAHAGPQRTCTHLHMAVERGNEKIVSALLCNPNTDKNSLGSEGHSPLMLACKKGDASMVEIFLAAGADVYFRESPGSDSALELAARFGHTDVIRVILQHAPDVDGHVDLQGYTPLHAAAFSNQACSVDALLDHGFYVDDKDSSRETPLHKAARRASHDALYALLRRRARVNARSMNGQTALHHACARKAKGVGTTVDLLLRSGASEALVNSTGNSPADMLGAEVDPFESEPCSGEELSRARALLLHAPADRAWRRRCWLIMLRARAESTELSHLAAGSECDSEERGGRKRLNLGNTDESAGASPACGEGRPMSDDGEVVAATGSLDGAVTALIGLRPQEVFRAVVRFV